MHPRFLLWVIIIVAVKSGTSGAGNSSDHTVSGRTCDGCPSDCSPHEPIENGTVQLFKSGNNSNKIYCSSSHAIRWEFGWDSDRIPLNGSTGKYFKTSSNEPNSPGSEGYCTGLQVIHWSSLWNVSSFFVKCTRKKGNESSRWYRLGGSKTFDPQEITKKPDEAVQGIQEMNLALTKFNPKFHTAHRPVSVKATKEANVSANGSRRSVPTTTSAMELVDQKVHQSDHQNSGKSSAESDLSTDRTVIFAVAGGAGACVMLLLLLVIFLVKKVKCQRKTIAMTKEEVHEFVMGVAAEKANAKGINGLFVLPYDTKLEIPKSDVNFRSSILGSGAFGQVVKGAYRGSPVAIKTLKNNACQNASYLRSLLSELKVMSYLGSHPNLVALIGAITRNIKGGEVYLIFEYCSHGNAHNFVRSHRDNFVDVLARPGPCDLSGGIHARFNAIYGTARFGVSLTTKDLVRWAYEVAAGMEYVAAQNVYHGDLAARNILLTEDLIAKVGDFGLSKQLDVEKYNCYVQRKECPLPLKWMAIESLRDLTFSIQSDVWSYGVTLWELFTLGTTPYPGMDWNFESWKLLCEGKRLGKPDYASDSIYDIMTKCWDAEPKFRPGFGQLRELMCRELQKF